MSFALAQYRSTKTATASPVRVLVQLYEAAIRFLHEGADAIEAKDYKTKGERLGKAHRIVTELQASLDEQHAPELCQQLSALYDFCLSRISHGNAKLDAAAVREAAKILSELHAGWREIAAQVG